MKKTKKCTILTKMAASSAAFCQDALFIDIETTGLSPARNRIYLIGAGYFEHPSVQKADIACEDVTDAKTDHISGTDTQAAHVTGSDAKNAPITDSAMKPDPATETSLRFVTEQFFAEKPEEEALLLSSFRELLSRFGTVITFHGTRFDLPFFQERGKRLETEIVYHNKNYVDLYQLSYSYRHIFCLENYKQKTIEKFLGIGREDTFSGSELIKHYKEYVKCPDDGLLQILLLHNYEDILGMAQLLSLYAFDTFFQGGFTPLRCEIQPCHKLDGSAAREALLECRLDEPLPALVSCNNGCFYLHAEKDRAIFRIPLLEGSLKFFYPNYKDYYYLPAEDTAIHKSVAAFVDKAHRQKAKAANCYVRKEGVFCPQYEEAVKPVFYAGYKDAVSYFEWTEQTAEDEELLKRYCMHMLDVLKGGKQIK